MPLTKKGDTILSAMQSEYGAKKGKSVFYASENKGTITGVEESKKKKPKEKPIRHRGKNFTIKDRSRQ